MSKWETLTDFGWGALVWADSAWQLASVLPGRMPWLAGRTVALGPQSWLLWLDRADLDTGRLLLAELTPSGFATPETVMAQTSLGDEEYAAAIGTRRRWVAHADDDYEHGSFDLSIRVAYSDTPGVWREVARRGIRDCRGVSIAPLGDSTALLAWDGLLGLQVVALEGAAWRPDSVQVDPRHWLFRPRFRARPSGGYWLAWSDGRIRVASNRSGPWVWEDSCTCAHPPGKTYYTGTPVPSQDFAERPVLAWQESPTTSIYRSVGCAAFPTDSGWTQGIEIPGCDDLGLTLAVVVDRNGDAWFAWDLDLKPIVFWTHTYVKATTSPPSLAGSGSTPRLSWTLSEPAPGSWWAVLRAPEGGEEEQVARFEAGADTLMTWTDTTAPSGSVLHYRIRRESVDQRYEWLSEEATWWPRESALRLEMTGPNPVAQALEFEIVGAAAGPLAIRLYDLQGRAVRKVDAAAQGAGRDAVRLELSSGEPAVRAGMYFLAVRDATGRTLPVRKVAVVR